MCGVICTAFTCILRICAGYLRSGNDRVVAEACRDYRKKTFWKNWMKTECE